MEDNGRDLNIPNKVKRLPGGLVIISLVLIVIIATFFPQAFRVGGYITALFYDENSATMGLLLTVCRSAINIRQVGMPLYKDVTLTGIKPLLGVAMGFLVGKSCGPAGILGLTPFVLIATITNSNGSLYISLSSQFGSATDTETISILSLNDGPFSTLMALGATGLASIPFKALVATLIPLLIGFIWGNMDKGFRDVCMTAQPIATFFMTTSIGSKTDVSTLVTVGASGIMLGPIPTAVAVVFFFAFNLLLPKKERGAIGVAVGTTALSSATMPTAVAQANPSIEPYVGMATAQHATAPIVTLSLCPSITTLSNGQMRENKRGIYSPEEWAAGKARFKRGTI